MADGNDHHSGYEATCLEIKMIMGADPGLSILKNDTAKDTFLVIENRYALDDTQHGTHDRHVMSSV